MDDSTRNVGCRLTSGESVDASLLSACILGHVSPEYLPDSLFGNAQMIADSRDGPALAAKTDNFLRIDFRLWVHGYADIRIRVSTSAHDRTGRE